MAARGVDGSTALATRSDDEEDGLEEHESDYCSLTMAPIEERRQIRALLEADSAVMSALEKVGASFNDNHVLDYTCTEKTRQALKTCKLRLRWLSEVSERQAVVGKDSKGLDVLKVVGDGTQTAETTFGEIEKVFLDTNGTHKESVWNGLLLEKIGRINEKARRELPGVVSFVHHNMMDAQASNALMRSAGRRLPHETLRPYAPRTNASYGVKYRRRCDAAAAAGARLTTRAPAAAAPARLAPAAVVLLAPGRVVSNSGEISAGAPAIGALAQAPVPTATPAAFAAPLPPHLDPLVWGLAYVRKPDSRPPAAKRPRPEPEASADGATAPADLPGIVPGMVTFGRGSVVRSPPPPPLPPLALLRCRASSPTPAMHLSALARQN